MTRWQKSSLYILYLFVSVGGILLLMELSLAIAHSVTDDRRLNHFPRQSSPDDVPENVLKIALFGGSSAAGVYSEVAMDLVIKSELKRRYPGLEFYFKKLARSAEPFHRHQAELLKSVIDQYDIFLIYAGHNETFNYIDDTGYRRDAEHKGDKHLKPFQPEESGPVEWVRTHSRIFAITRKINEKYIHPHVPYDSPEPRRPRRYELFEAEKALPPAAMKAVDDNFEADLREIAKLAEERGKTVIISNVPSPERYPPVFSVHKAGLGAEELEAFDDAYQRGMEMYDRKEFDRAIDHFLIAAEIDDQAAILNHMLGKAYLETGDAARGRLHLRRGIDNDGLPLRSLSSIHRISESVAREYDSVHYIDTVQSFRDARDKGTSPYKLFVDFQHPGPIGHIIIGRNFVSEMSKLDPLKGIPIQAESPDLDATDLEGLLREYGVPPWDKRRFALIGAIVNLFIWPVMADPASPMDSATRYIEIFYENSDKTPADESLMLLFLALVAGESADTGEAIKLANQATKLSPGFVQESLYGNIYLDGRDFFDGLIKRFNLLELDFSTTDKEFFLMDAS